MNKHTSYLVVDTETATLPFVNEWGLSADDKKKLAIAKPLVYDIGWTIANRTQGIVKKCCYLVAEIFCVPAIFNTAYYKDKRPKYLEMIAKGEAEVKPWDEIMKIFLEDLANCKYMTAYNIMFDAKKAIPFTELYIRNLYSPFYQEWENIQRESCRRILNEKKKQNERDFDPEHFIFRGEKYPMIDIWGVACKYLLNNSKYKNMCLKESKISNSGLYFTTNAEVAMQYLSQRFDFIEDHTALSDAEIETEILFYCLKRGKIIVGIEYFPFKMLGYTTDYVQEARGVTEAMAKNVAKAIREYLGEGEPSTPYQKQTYNRLMVLENFMEENWG